MEFKWSIRRDPAAIYPDSANNGKTVELRILVAQELNTALGDKNDIIKVCWK